MHCKVCDYAEGFGSTYANLRNDGNRTVRFHKQLGDYYCTVCATDIIGVITEFNQEDQALGKETVE